jgi:hypothetical protein
MPLVMGAPARSLAPVPTRPHTQTPKFATFDPSQSPKQQLEDISALELWQAHFNSAANSSQALTY